MFNKMISIVLCFLLCIVEFINPSVSLAQGKKEYILAILDLNATGISETEAKILSNNLRGAISRVLNSEKFRKSNTIEYKIVERSDMEKVLDELELQRKGCTDIACAVEFGKILNTDKIIIGSVGLIGQTYTINTSLVDVETARVLRAADFKIKGAIDDVLNKGIPEVANELFGIKKSRIKYYFGGGLVVIAGVLAYIFWPSDEGTISIKIPAPED